MSPATVHHMEAVFSIIKTRWSYGWFGREYGYLGGIFLNATLQAAVHLGQDYEANLRYVKNYFWNCVGQLSNETGKLISEQKEIIGVNIIEFKDSTWMSTSLLCSQAYRITHAKAYLFSGDENGRWSFCDLKFKRYSENNHFKVMNRIDGMPTEFQRKNIHNVGPPREDSKSFERPRVWTWALQWQDHLHVNVQWRIMLANSLWIRREMVRNLHWQTRRIIGSNCREHDGKFLKIRASNNSCHQCLWDRRITKQRRGQEVCTLQW